MMSSQPILYYLPASPPSRAVVAVARMLKLQLELKPVQIDKKENLSEEYLKLNPFHQIPTLVEPDGFVLPESRAICTYLVQSRRPGGSPLYPNDVRERATVDRWLHFDSGFFLSLRTVAAEMFHAGSVTEFRMNTAKEMLDCLDKALEHTAGGRFLLGGQQSTVADISMYCTTTMLEALPGFDVTQYGHLNAWYQSVAQLLQPYDQDGLFSEAVQCMRDYVQRVKSQMAE